MPHYTAFPCIALVLREIAAWPLNCSKNKRSKCQCIMALLTRFIRLPDRANTHVFTFVVTRSVTRDLHRDVTSKEFGYGYHRWAITFSRAGKVLGVYLVWRNPSEVSPVSFYIIAWYSLLLCFVYLFVYDLPLINQLTQWSANIQFKSFFFLYLIVDTNKICSSLLSLSLSLNGVTCNFEAGSMMMVMACCVPNNTPTRPSLVTETW